MNSTKQILELSLDRIEENPFDARKSVTGVEELATSFLSVGQLVPIIVRSVDDYWVLVAGHRRYAAAKKLGWATIQCIVANKDETLAYLALAGISENTSRVDLSQSEIVNAIDLLAGMEVSDDEIVRALSVKPETVDAAKRIAAAGKSHRSTVEKLTTHYPLTLLDQARIVEFADDPKSVEKITQTVQFRPSDLEHTLARLEHERKRKATIEELKASVGKTKILKPFDPYYGPPTTTEPLANLVSDKGKKLTLTNHHECPGHAAMIEVDPYSDRAPIISYWCTEWEAQGHRLSEKERIVWRGRGVERSTKAAKKSPAETKKAAEEKALETQRQADWDAATSVREDFVQNLAQHKLAADVKMWTLTYVVENGIYDTDRVAPNATLEQVFGKLFALAATSCEENEFNYLAWKTKSDEAVKYLKMLVDQGYVLSDIEKMIEPRTKVVNRKAL